jgi:hypothetical protein
MACPLSASLSLFKHCCLLVLVLRLLLLTSPVARAESHSITPMRAHSSIGGASPRPNPAGTDPALPTLSRMFQMAATAGPLPPPPGAALATQRAPPTIVVRAPPLPPQLALPSHKNAPLFPTYAHGTLSTLPSASSASSSSFLAAAGVGNATAVAAAARIGETAFSSDEAFRAWLDAPGARTPSGKQQHHRQPHTPQQRATTATPSRHSSSSSHEGVDASHFAVATAASVYNTPLKALASPLARTGAEPPPPSSFSTASLAAAQIATANHSGAEAVAAASNAAFAFGASAFRTSERDAIGAIDRELNLAMHEAVDEYLIAMDEAAISARDAGAGAFALGATEDASMGAGAAQTLQSRQRRRQQGSAIDMEMDLDEEDSASADIGEAYQEEAEDENVASPSTLRGGVLAAAPHTATPRRRPASHALLRSAANGSRSTVSFGALPSASSSRRADILNAATPTPASALRSKSAMANTSTPTSSSAAALSGPLSFERASFRSPAAVHAGLLTSPSYSSSTTVPLSSAGDASIVATLRLAQSQHAALDAALARLQQVWGRTLSFGCLHFALSSFFG